MPSLFRFLSIVAVIAGLSYAALFAIAVYLEPETQEVSKPVHGVTIRNQ